MNLRECPPLLPPRYLGAESSSEKEMLDIVELLVQCGSKKDVDIRSNAPGIPKNTELRMERLSVH